MSARRWRQMSTAPRDGTVILLRDLDLRVRAGAWTGEDGFPWMVFYGPSDVDSHPENTFAEWRALGDDKP